MERWQFEVKDKEIHLQKKTAWTMWHFRPNSHALLAGVTSHISRQKNTADLWVTTSSHLLTLRAQFTKSSSLVITYSPLLLATAAGLAAATAVLFSLTGTTLQQKDGGDLYHVQRVYRASVLHSDIYTRVYLVNSPRGGILAFCTVVQTPLMNSKHWNRPGKKIIDRQWIEWHKR